MNARTLTSDILDEPPSVLSDFKCQFICCAKDIFHGARRKSSSAEDVVDGRGEELLTSDSAETSTNHPHTKKPAQHNFRRFLCCHTTVHNNTE